MTTRGLAAWRHELHELAFRTLLRLAAAGGDRDQGLVYAAYFGWLYRRPDPWQYQSSRYELTKYARTLAALRGTPASNVLEAGCGEGVFSEMLLREGLATALVGVDVSGAALARAASRCRAFPRARFVQANLAAAAPEGPFDLIVCAELLYYLGSRSNAASVNLSARLALGGRLVGVHPADRADLLHAPWRDDPTLVAEQRVECDDAERPYVIEVFRRVS